MKWCLCSVFVCFSLGAMAQIRTSQGVVTDSIFKRNNLAQPVSREPLNRLVVSEHIYTSSSNGMALVTIVKIENGTESTQTFSGFEAERKMHELEAKRMNRNVRELKLNSTLSN